MYRPILSRTLPLKIFVRNHSHPHHELQKIVGNREIVGYGYNGQPVYADRVDFPFPAIRWREISPDLQALHEKEKGDWRKLTLEEKKCLYRASFCQTFEEMKAPTGEWKGVIGGAAALTALGLWIYYFMKTFVYRPLPKSFKEKNRSMQLRRMIDLRVNPVTGISSKWDYDNNRWK